MCIKVNIKTAKKKITHRMKENVSSHLVRDSYPKNILKTLTT